MIVVVRSPTSGQGVAQAVEFLSRRQVDARPVAWGTKTLLVTQRNPAVPDTSELKETGLVERIVVSSSKAQLASREFQNKTSVIEVGEARFGTEKIVVIAGPCSVEGREQLLEVARAVKKSGASLLRGGVFKDHKSNDEG